MRKSVVGAASGVVSFAASDFGPSAKIQGVVIQTVIALQAATSHGSIVIANDQGGGPTTIAAFNFDDEPVWLTKLNLFIPLAYPDDSVTVTISGSGTVRLTVEAGAIGA